MIVILSHSSSLRPFSNPFQTSKGNTPDASRNCLPLAGKATTGPAVETLSGVGGSSGHLAVPCHGLPSSPEVTVASPDTPSHTSWD